MQKQTLFDVYKEMGAAANLLLILFLAILAYGCVIHFRKLDYGWRKSFLVLAGVQAAFGVMCCAYSIFDAFFWVGRSALGLHLKGGLAVMLEIIGIVPFACWLTTILLVFSAVLFVTGKKVESTGGGHAAVPTEKQPDGSAIRHL